jgi:HK97 family phage major capsid protein
MNKKEQRAKLIAELRAMHELAQKENRAFTDDESKAFAEKEAEVRKLSQEIAAEEREALLKGFTTELPKTEGESRGEVSDKMKEFRNYLLNGEKRDISVGSGGGALSPQEFVAEIIKGVENDSPLYGLVRKFPLSEAKSLGAPYEAADASDASWTAEVPVSDITADATLAYSLRELSPNTLVKLIKISDKLVKVSALPIEQIVKEKITEKLVAAFENGITVGTGSGQPLGVFTASANGVPTSRDVTTAGATLASDDLIKTKMSLKPAYRRKARWVMSTDILTDCLLLKDKNDQYLWRPGLRDGDPDTLLGLPVIESAYAPSTKTSGSYIAVLGDFSYYWWAYVDGIEIKNLVELFALKNQLGFKGTAYADGAPVLAEAFSRVKVGTSE